MRPGIGSARLSATVKYRPINPKISTGIARRPTFLERRLVQPIALTGSRISISSSSSAGARRAALPSGTARDGASRRGAAAGAAGSAVGGCWASRRGSRISRCCMPLLLGAAFCGAAAGWRGAGFPCCETLAACSALASSTTPLTSAKISSKLNVRPPLLLFCACGAGADSASLAWLFFGVGTSSPSSLRMSLSSAVSNLLLISVLTSHGSGGALPQTAGRPRRSMR